MKKGKKYVEAAKLVDKTTQYEVQDAVSLIKKTAVAKFDETIEAHIRLGVDGRHADQQVRGAVVLFAYSYLQRVQSLMRHRLQVLISLVARSLFLRSRTKDGSILML